MVYLIVAAGHKRDSEEVRAGGLNCLPLDLYTIAAVTGVSLLIAAGGMLTSWAANTNAGSFQWGLVVLVYCPSLARRC